MSTMDKITEVGHKMRSAIKAKLIELGCYVDDELPDYIMVMVANHRSKEMMLEDLQLFLDDNTEVFVNWLHQVLQKLHEVTVNNIDIPKIAKQEARLKRKMVESKSNKTDKKEKIKEKEKDKDKEKDKPKQKKIKKEKENKSGSLTDEIPVSAKTIVERRISLNKEKTLSNVKPIDTQLEDQFDIPSVSEVDKLELVEIETKIEAAKRKLALLESEVDDSDFINIKADEEFFENEFAEEIVSNKSKLDQPGDIKSNETIESRTPPRKVTIRNSDTQGNTPIKSKPSVMDRLGERTTSRSSTEKIVERKSSPVRKKIRLSEIKKVEEELLGISNSNNKNKKSDNNKKTQKQSGSHDRSGLMSHVIPISKSNKRSKSPSSSPPPMSASIPSVVQIKPRKLLPQSVQPNKNLLLKAVAEAQKSVSAISLEASNKDKINNNSNDDDSQLPLNKKELFTARYKKSVANIAKENIKNIVIKVQSDNKIQTEADKNPSDKQKKTELNLVDANLEQDNEDLDYIPTNIELCENDQEFEDNIVNEQKPRFIVTLNGLDESIFKSKEAKSSKRNSLQRENNEGKETDSIFEQKEEKQEKKSATEKKNIEIDTPKKTRKPSPITFNKSELEKKDDSGPLLPLPKVYPALPLKVKERCKYWPGCRLGDSCEYVHPSQPCKMFPLCKFGDRCLYIHPPCKFDIACSRRGCPYTHCYTKPVKMPLIASTVVSVSHSTEPVVPTLCKYYPNCSNVQCSFYHPKPCRFGKYCLNKNECNFCHSDVPSKEKLKWKSS